jgi:exopolysaccharide production protein ExoQ
MLAERTLPRIAPRARGMARSAVIPLWEKGFALFGLFLCLDAGIRTLKILSGIEGPVATVRTEGNYAEGSALTQVLLFGVYIVSFILLATRPMDQLARAFRPKLLWFLPALAVLSVLWSGAPTISFRRAVALAGSFIFGVYLATRYPRAMLFRFLLVISVIAIGLSFVVSIALPTYSIDPISGAWQGVFGQKNQLGQFMALAAVMWLIYAVSVKRRRLLVGAGLLSVVLLLLSRSATAIVILLALLAVLGFVRLLRVRSIYALPVLMLAIVAAGYLVVRTVSDPGAALAALGRDSSLTGRTQLWSIVWQMIRARFGLGYGYGGFWLGFEGPSGPVWLATGWEPPSAHDGFLDLMLDLGVVGLLVFVPIMIAALRYAYALALRGKTLESAFPFIFLIFLLISNVTESYLVAYNSLSWVLFVAITIQLSMWWQEERRPHARAVARAPARADDRPVSRPVRAARQQECSTAQEGSRMKAQVTVSAIMPTYNAMPHVKEAIDSVLAQTFQDWELIVVDDGSTDGTTEFLATYTDPRIRVFELGENRGPAHARNVALGFACGKYIAPCDSDDIFLPERFAREVAYLESHPEIHVVATQMMYFTEGEAPRRGLLYPEDPAAIDRRFAKGKMAVPFGASMIRSWCFDRFGPFCEDLRRAQDFEWFMRIRRSCNFRVLPSYLYLYRHDAKRVTWRKWITNARYARYAVYRARVFGASANPALSFDRFSRRWSTRVGLYTRDVLRFVNFRLRANTAGRTLG